MLDKCFNFVLAYPSSVVSKILNEFSPKSGSALIADPFCGTGTTLVECKRRGLNSIGIDANPVCVLAARVKTRWEISEKKLQATLSKVLKRVRLQYRHFETTRELSRQYLHPTKWPVFKNTKQGRFLIKSGLLKRGWISPTPALKCLLVVNAIENCEDKIIKDFLLVSLLGLLVPNFSNVKYGPEIYCNRRRVDVDVFGIFEKRVKDIHSSILEHRKMPPLLASSKVLKGNSLNGGLASLKKKSVTHIITSPPYPAEHDYTRMTRLELAFAGYISDTEDLRKIKRNMVPCSSKSSYIDQNYYDHVKHFHNVNKLRTQIQKASKKKKHGFARVYPRLVGDYFGGMFLHFLAIKPYLKPGAKCAYVVGDQSSFFGIHIRTADILKKILESKRLGFKVMRTEVFRKRHTISGNRKKRIPETIIYFQKPLIQRKKKIRAKN